MSVAVSRQIYIVWMVIDCLMQRMGSEPNLPVKRSVPIGTMLNFDSDGHRHGDGDGTCKQAFKITSLKLVSNENRTVVLT